MSRPGPDEPLSLALVGCGAVTAGHYLPAIAASRRVAATLLVDLDEGRARALAGRWGVPGVATDVAEVAGRADAAVVALPNHLHAPVTIDLLRRGVPVLVEKPMAISSAECDAMIAAAEEAGVTLAVGLQFRLFEATRWARDALAAGLLGALRGFDLRLGVVSRWPFASDYFLRRETAGGGVLVDYGVHVLDLLLVWLGDLECRSCRHDARGGIESDALLELRTASGALGTVEISRSRNLRNTCVFVGERGELEVGIWDPDPAIALRAADGPVALVGRARVEGVAPLDFDAAFRRSLDDFADAVRRGRAPLVDGREGRRSVALIERSYAVASRLELPWERPAALYGAGA